MEKLIVGRGFGPQIIEKAAQALMKGVRRPIMSSGCKKWLMINVGYRHRLLLKGDGKAELMTHESILKYLSHRAGNCK